MLQISLEHSGEDNPSSPLIWAYYLCPTKPRSEIIVDIPQQSFTFIKKHRTHTIISIFDKNVLQIFLKPSGLRGTVYVNYVQEIICFWEFKVMDQFSKLGSPHLTSFLFSIIAAVPVKQSTVFFNFKSHQLVLKKIQILVNPVSPATSYTNWPCVSCMTLKLGRRILWKKLMSESECLFLGIRFCAWFFNDADLSWE